MRMKRLRSLRLGMTVICPAECKTHRAGLSFLGGGRGQKLDERTLRGAQLTD